MKLLISAQMAVAMLASLPVQAQGISDARLNQMIVARALAEGKGLAQSYAEIEALKHCGKKDQNRQAGWEAYKMYMSELLVGLPSEYAEQRDASIAKDLAHYEAKYNALQKSCPSFSDKQKELSAMQTTKKIRYNTFNVQANLKKLK
jgi:hypothetical protein